MLRETKWSPPGYLSTSDSRTLCSKRSGLRVFSQPAWPRSSHRMDATRRRAAPRPARCIALSRSLAGLLCPLVLFAWQVAPLPAFVAGLSLSSRRPFLPGRLASSLASLLSSLADRIPRTGPHRDRDRDHSVCLDTLACPGPAVRETYCADVADATRSLAASALRLHASHRRSAPPRHLTLSTCPL